MARLNSGGDLADGSAVALGRPFRPASTLLFFFLFLFLREVVAGSRLRFWSAVNSSSYTADYARCQRRSNSLRSILHPSVLL